MFIMTEPIIFNLNDNVTCLNAKPLSGNNVAPPLTEGSSYPVSEIHTCGCGKQHLGLGLPMNYNWVKCYTCGEEMPTHTHWCHPSRFSK